MNDEMQWETPPSPGVGSRQQFVEQLKARPGEWARWPRIVSNAVSSQNQREFPGTEWTQRRQPDGTIAIWGRWVGES